MIFLYSNEYLIDISHHVHHKSNNNKETDNKGQDDAELSTVDNKGSNLVVSRVLPVLKTGSTSQLPTPSITGPLPNDSLKHLTDDIYKLSEFITNSRTYVGPQLTISIT